MNLINTKPEHRIIYKVASTMLVLHINQSKELREDIINNDYTIEQINNEYDDL